MAENAVQRERRHHKRSPVSSGIIAVLIAASPEIIGSVTDISLGGAKITYHNPKSRDFDYNELKVDLISDDRFVEAIPCINAWDRSVESGNFVAAGELRQCGIRFGDMNPNQMYLLRSFINRCAASGVNTPQQPKFPETATQ